jgi:hypothetical protein
MEAATIEQDAAQLSGVPIEVLEALLHNYLGDQRAMITSYACAPFPHLGTNDSSTISRVTLDWSVPASSLGSKRTTWILKAWKADGDRDGGLGILQPREALAWEQGWLRPSALPKGMVVPIIGAHRLPDNSAAWLVMEDVSTELSAYQRMSLSGEEAIRYTRSILARLAFFHARWEEAERQRELEACAWLPHPESYLWDMASTYAAALGRASLVKTPLYTSAPPVWEGLSADLEAFLEARPRDERRLWEEFMIDRQPLVEALAGYPQTLLHNDLDDRNIGLRWSGGLPQMDAEERDKADLLLIDWEWLALGPAALDVANLILRLPVMIAPGTPIPEKVWNNELAGYYFEHYRAAGGRCADWASWRRSFGLATVVKGLAQMPFVHGSLRRSIRGEAPLPQIVGVPEEVVRQNLSAGLPMMERMEKRIFVEMRRRF